MRFKEILCESEVTKFADSVKDSLGLKQFALIDKGDEIILSSLMIDKSSQGQGLGSKAMQLLVDFADKVGKRIVLTPGTKSAIDGTTSRGRLVKFYKRFGFKENKGRNIDFAMGAGKMFRDPQIKEYKVDNVDGLGAVPYNQEVDYRGLRVMMKPTTFLRLAAPLVTRTSYDYIRTYLEKGGALGAPFLKVEIPDEWFDGDFSESASIVGHEGRNRMSAAYVEEGDHLGEVHLFPRTDKREVRAKHLTPEIIENLNKGMYKQGTKVLISGPLFELTKDSLNEAPLPSDWDEDVFTYDTSIPNDPDTELYDETKFNRILKYAERARRLGQGSSRTVHSVNIDGIPSALKIAHNKSGLFQNAEEVKFLQNPEIKALNLTVKLIDYDKKHELPLWVQTEQVKPEDEEIFFKKYGTSPYHVQHTVEKYGFDGAIKKIQETTKLTPSQHKNLTKLIKQYQVLAKHGVFLNDLMGDNWGIDNKGNPIIVDLGYSKGYQNKEDGYYSNRVDEAPLPSDWDEDVFTYDSEKVEDPNMAMYSQQPFDPMIKYVEDQQAKYLGKGSARTVHSVNYEGKPSALKIAHNKAGLFQNTEEVRLLQKPEIQALNITASLIDYDKKNKFPVWVQLEKMNPKDERIFSIIYGWGSLKTMNAYLLDGLRESITLAQNDETLTNKQKKRLIGLLNKFDILKKNGIGVGDLAGSNWGIDNNGMPKIVDLGYSDSFIRSFNSGSYKSPEDINESKEFQIGVNINDEVKKFTKWAKKILHVKKKIKVVLSYNSVEARNGHHTGRFVNGENKIWVYANRNLVDICRTIAHELTHVRQGELGMIRPGSSYPGSPIEVLADAMAGKLIKIYGASNNHIFQ